MDKIFEVLNAIKPILPETIVAVAGIFVMLSDAFSQDKKKTDAAWIAFAGILAGGFATFRLWSEGVSGEAFSGMIVTDSLRLIFIAISLFVSGLTVLTSVHWLEEDDLPEGEFYALLLFATVGMMLMAGAGDLVMIFLGLEILSIATYVMAGFRRRDLRSNESALKYYILGSFSTAFLLYGMALVYGATRTTNLDLIAQAITKDLVAWPGLLLAGVGMMLVGLCFKVAAAPFHVWTPDVYEGAPSVVTGWMSTGPKAAAFSAFVRLFVITFATAAPLADIKGASTWALVIVAGASMILGNVVAMVQNNIKRMLAYSSIAHAGYALVGFVAGEWRAVAFYMLAYAFMNLGAFAIVATIARRSDRAVTFDDYRGIGFDSLPLSITLSIFMLSLAGFPMTAGFMGKLLIFKAAWGQGFHWLVIIGVLASAASVYYYLRPIIVMFFNPAPDGERPRIPIPTATAAALTVAVIFVFYLGLVPNPVLQLLGL
jgi:NADH-quinone oxidoreductase subunit N